MVNVTALPPVKVPAVIVTVNTPAAEMAAEPAAPDAGAVKPRVPAPTMASPAPLSVMTILPSIGIVAAGIRFTVMVTPLAPLTALLSVTSGFAVPSESMITGNACAERVSIVLEIKRVLITTLDVTA